MKVWNCASHFPPLAAHCVFLPCTCLNAVSGGTLRSDRLRQKQCGGGVFYRISSYQSHMHLCKGYAQEDAHGRVLQPAPEQVRSTVRDISRPWTEGPARPFTTLIMMSHMNCCVGVHVEQFHQRTLRSCTAYAATTSDVASSDPMSIDAATPPVLSGTQIRSKFLEFYASRGHKVLPSASLVPEDPTVLLTIAGTHFHAPTATQRDQSKSRSWQRSPCLRASCLFACPADCEV